MKTIFVKSLLCAATLFPCINVNAVTVAGGSGTEGDPYQIATPAQLKSIGNDSSSWDKYFVLTADIDMIAQSVKPIGDGETKFTGSFDGNGHAISNLTIDMTGEDFVGLFGWISSCTIVNVGLVDANIKGRDYVGGLVGSCDYSSIVDCHVTGYATTVLEELYTEPYIGGLVGETYYSTIRDCYSAVNVTGTADFACVGGLVGDNFFSTLINCHATGTVRSTAAFPSVGGLVGWNDSSNIKNCFASASVIGQTEAGGLVGWNDSSSVRNCYATGEVRGTSEIGGLVGLNDNSSIVSYCYATGRVEGNKDTGGLVGGDYVSTIRECYWDKDSTGQLNSAGSESSYGLTTAEFTTKDFSGIWPFGCNVNSPWADPGNQFLPFLYWQKKVVTVPNVSSTTRTTAQLAGWFNAALQYIEYGFEVDDDINFSDPNQFSTNFNHNGNYSIAVNGLSGDTIYYFRAYVKIADNNYYGDIGQFTTSVVWSLIDMLYDSSEAREVFENALIDAGINNVEVNSMKAYQDSFLINFDYVDGRSDYLQLIVDTVNIGDSVVLATVCNGWNLVSTPFNGWSLADIYDNMDSKLVFEYDASKSVYNTLTNLSILEPGRGYWIYFDDSEIGEEEEVEYVMIGRFETESHGEYPVGWNLIGPIRNGESGSTGSSFSWDMLTQQYQLHTGLELKLGKGYWLFNR